MGRLMDQVVELAGGNRLSGKMFELLSYQVGRLRKMARGYKQLEHFAVEVSVTRRLTLLQTDDLYLKCQSTA
jgi:hypothetical protein